MPDSNNNGIPDVLEEIWARAKTYITQQGQEFGQNIGNALMNLPGGDPESAYRWLQENIFHGGLEDIRDATYGNPMLQDPTPTPTPLAGKNQSPAQPPRPPVYPPQGYWQGAQPGQMPNTGPMNTPQRPPMRKIPSVPVMSGGYTPAYMDSLPKQPRPPMMKQSPAGLEYLKNQRYNPPNVSDRVGSGYRK